VRAISWLALAALLFVLTGCSFSGAPSWLQGDWIFDADASEKAADETANAQRHAGIVSHVYSPLLSAFSSTEVSITDKEVLITITGKGNAQTYEVVSSVPDQECLLKLSDGTLLTYHKAGEGIYTYTDWGPKIKLFYKRKP